MQRLGVSEEAPSVGAVSGSSDQLQGMQTSPAAPLPEMDMDALFRSFLAYEPSLESNGAVWPAPVDGSGTSMVAPAAPAQDVLYGLVGSGNESVLDSLFRTANL